MNILNWKRKFYAPSRNFGSSWKIPILKINGTKSVKKEKLLTFKNNHKIVGQEPLKENQISKELVIFGVSIMKYIMPENISKYDPQHAVNLSKSGAKVEGIYEQLIVFQKVYKGIQFKNIVIHVGTNHLLPENTAKKI